MDIYNIIINDPVYLTIAVLISLIVLFSIIKKYARLILFSIATFVLYLGYIWFNGSEIPESTSDLKKQIAKDGELMLNKAKKIITKN